MIFSKLWFRCFWLGCLVLGLVVTVKYFKVETSILKLLPKYESVQTNTLIDKATEKVNQQMVLLASSNNKALLTDQFSAQLKAIEPGSLFKSVNYQVDTEQFMEVYQTLSDYRQNLISFEDQLSIEAGYKADYFVNQAKEYLYGVQQLSQSQLSQDPLFLFQRYMESLAQLKVMTFDNSESYYLTQNNDMHHMVAFLELSDSAFLPENQTLVVDKINQIKTNLLSSTITLSSFGSVNYAHQAYLDAKQEISTVGLGSMIGIVLLIMLVFRSLTPLLLSIGSISLGLLFALAVAMWVFGEIHIFALVFGATIAGVSIDYCFHYLVDSSLSKTDHNNLENNFSTKQIMPALFIGFFSSALVYLGFVVTGYEVLSQISLFSVVGLLAVLINVLVLFPWLFKAKPLAHTTQLKQISKVLLNNPLMKVFKQPLVPISVLILLVLTCCVMIKPNDNVRALQQLSPQLKQQEAYIREVLTWPNNESYVLINDEKIDNLLIKEAELLKYLRTEQPGIVGISDYLPSNAQQIENYQFEQSLYNSTDFKAHVSELQIPSNTAQTFQALDPLLLNKGVFSAVFKQRWLGEVNGQFALIIPLVNYIEIPAEFGVTLIQQAEDTSTLFSEFRIKSTWVLALTVLLLVLLLTIVRYSWLTALHLVSLPLVAGFTALTVAWLLGLHISLFSILALLLILGMGLDYVVFLIESKHPQHVMLALMLSSCTTILAFGLLGFSQVAVLQSFGFMVGIGIALVLLISPAILHGNNTGKKDNEQSF